MIFSTVNLPSKEISEHWTVNLLASVETWNFFSECQDFYVFGHPPGSYLYSEKGLARQFMQRELAKW